MLVEIIEITRFTIQYVLRPRVSREEEKRAARRRRRRHAGVLARIRSGGGRRRLRTRHPWADGRAVPRRSFLQPRAERRERRSVKSFHAHEMIAGIQRQVAGKNRFAEESIRRDSFLNLKSVDRDAKS